MSSFSSKLHGALINPLYKGMLEFRRLGKPRIPLVINEFVIVLGA